LASAGKGGIWGLLITGTGALGCEGFGPLAQETSSIPSTGSISRSRTNLTLGMVHHLRLLLAPLRLDLPGSL
jgi:hypothetical protein